MRSALPLFASVLLAACSSSVAGDRPDGGDPGADASGEDIGVPAQVENLEPGEILRHELALVTGSVDPAATAITVEGGGQEHSWPVVGGRFKALVPLSPGRNDLIIGATGSMPIASASFYLDYEPQTNPHRVRLVYLVGSDGDGRFEAPANEPSDTASAVARLQLAGRLLQSFTAEKMAAEGFGRRTFRLERDAAGEPVIEIFHSALSTAELRAMTGNELWSHFYGELGLGDQDEVKVMAFLSMTDYDPATGEAAAHTALGGGHFALFGTGALHTWAPSLDQLVARFSDETRIDTAQLFDDSAGRGTHWANYATGLGASMHEVGHTLSLPHPVDPSTVMGRGFDHINRSFMMVEPPSDRDPGIDPITAADERGFTRSNTVRLRYHRWLALDARDYAVNVAPTMSVVGGELRIQSAAGIRHIDYMLGGDGADHDELLEAAPTDHRIPLDDLRARFPGEAELRVTVIDDDGNIAELDVAL